MAPKLKGRFASKYAGTKKTMKNTKVRTSVARLDAWARGVIWGMHLGQMKRQDMLAHVTKKDGAPLLLHTLDDVIAKTSADPQWRGEDSSAGGRPHELDKKERKQVVDLVFRERGRAKVTIAYCKKKLKFLRRVGDQCVSETLQDAGLKWMSRRLKWYVPAHHKDARVLYAGTVLRKHQATLDRYVYSDGTTFYLARTCDEKGQKARGALGKFVYRMASGKDGLFEDNIGPSMYAKAQGFPVKIWGFLGNGRLEYWVLPRDANARTKTTHMNGKRYQDLAASKFVGWRKACFGDNKPCDLIQDHERCLWSTASVEALKKAGCPPVENYPACSPDLNAIENVWAELRKRLAETEVVHLESRADFIARLRRCVNWLNENKAEEMLGLCTNQKKRARDVLAATPPGSRTKW
jgi:hypothetical protein